MIILTYNTSSQLSGDRQDFCLEVLHHGFHTGTQDVQVGIVAELEKI